MDIFKENLHTFSKFSINVITDLYKLSFQNYCASLIYVVIKLHRSLLGVKGGGGGCKNNPFNSPLSNI